MHVCKRTVGKYFVDKCDPFAKEPAAPQTVFTYRTEAEHFISVQLVLFVSVK